MPAPKLNIRKIAQMAARFLDKEQPMSKLKIVKLMYLADRQSMKECGFSISDDRFVSMMHGPTLPCIEGLLIGGHRDQQDWDDLIDDNLDHRVKLRRPLTDLDRDLLSPADCDVIDGVQAEFGGMNQWQIRDYSRQNCPEWQDPDGSVLPIDEHDIFVALGYNREQAEDMAEQMEEQRSLMRCCPVSIRRQSTDSRMAT